MIKVMVSFFLLAAIPAKADLQQDMRAIQEGRQRATQVIPPSAFVHSNLELPNYSAGQVCGDMALHGDNPAYRLCVSDEQWYLNFLRAAWPLTSDELKGICLHNNLARGQTARAYSAIGGCVLRWQPTEVMHHGPTELR